MTLAWGESLGLPDISFDRIRPHDGSRDVGFEELCSQLASLEPRPPGAAFIRKGRGADAGVECHLQYPDGTERGWQAKYLFTWNSGLVSQLDESIRTALNRHPSLREYVVCLPFDLPDAHKANAKSARQKWNDWCTKWKNVAGAEGRTLEIGLWGRSELTARLVADNAKTGGRILYWFGDEAFSQAWFVEQFAKSKAALGARYTPETNVELPIRHDFLGFTRDDELQRQLDCWFIKVSDEGRYTTESIVRAAKGGPETHSARISAAINYFKSLINGPAVGPEAKYPVIDWLKALTRCNEEVRDGLSWAYSLPESPGPGGSDPVRWARHQTYKLRELLSDIVDALESRRWQLANATAVLLTGPAGIGKSHLLADIVEHQVYRGRPAILILGSSFRDDEPWRQILAQLDRPPNEQTKHFLGSLDALAEASGTRALICIDALNERHGVDLWPNHLAAFLKTVEQFPRIGIILSCRTTYVTYVIPTGPISQQLTVIEHHGFAADGGEAAKTYLDKRGIIRQGAPNLVPEVNNPLFLKTCCDFLEQQGKTELPRGLRGVTSIFNFYNTAVTESLNKRMQLDPHFEIIPKSIAALAKRLAEEGRGYLSKSEIIDLFENIRPSNGNRDASLLTQLEGEGILSIEPVRQNDGSLTELVRFTFERFSDHAIAEKLLVDWLDKDDLLGSFAVGRPLNEFVFGNGNYRRAGVIEAIAIHLPENTGLELPDAFECEDNYWTIRRAFKESLLWREQLYFTNRTLEIAKYLFHSDEFNELLISISSEPDNKYNARYLNSLLADLSLPDRDEQWSIFLAQNDMSGSVETLIDWATGNGLEVIEDERGYLAALTLVWLLTTPNRRVRDKATKGLACILAPRLGLAARLIEQFATVNDPYVLERLVTASYGAAMQGMGDELGQLATAIYKVVFADGSPRPDALMRESKHGILLYAEWRGMAHGGIDLATAAPPYTSAWPIEHVPDELIETYKYKHPKGTFRDAIVSSTVNDGDFARYQMDHKVDQWSPTPIGSTTLPTIREVALQWLSEFKAKSTQSQRKIFDDYVDAAQSIDPNDRYKSAKTPEKERLDNAESSVKKALTKEDWEDFRVRALNFVRHGDGDEWHNNTYASFDTRWARRWVCKRAHDLGWTAKRFAEFDEFNRGYDRYDHRIERVGKKYQWIALRELVARLADNLAYKGNSWDRGEGIPSYIGPRQVSLRDIDPSLLATKTYYDGWAERRRTWWAPLMPNLRAATPQERMEWLHSDRDIINDANMIDVTEPKTGRRYLALSGFGDWKGRGVRDGHEEYQRDTWFRIQSVLVRKIDQQKFVEKLSGKILTDPHSLPKIELHGEFYLGEYPWHPELKNFGNWTEPENDWRDFPVSVRATVAKYMCEKSGYDYSIDETIVFEMPAPWIAYKMGLRLRNGRSPIYVDSAGQDIFFDPSVLEPGAAGAVVERESFLQMLESEGLSCVWVISGEKGVYGGRSPAEGFGGRLLHSAIYSLSNDGFTRTFHTDREKPSREQIEALYGDINGSTIPAEFLKNVRND